MNKYFLTKHTLENTILAQIKVLDKLDDVVSVEIEFLGSTHPGINWKIKSITRSVSNITKASWVELKFVQQVVDAAYKQVSATFNLQPPSVS